MKIKNFLILSLFLTSLNLVSCQKSEDPAPVAKTGIEMTVTGAVDFGKVNINESSSISLLKIVNHGPVSAEFLGQIDSPFKVKTISPDSCTSGIIVAGMTCYVQVTFNPIQVGPYEGYVVVGDSKFKFTGVGLDPAGLIFYSQSEFSSLSLTSDIAQEISMTLTNNGNYTVYSPVPKNWNEEYSMAFTDCGSYLGVNKSCVVKINVKKKLAGSFSDTIVLSSVNAGDKTLFVSGSVAPGIPAGSIAISHPPSRIVADGESTEIITSLPIKDKSGNIVADGTEVILVPVNLYIVGLQTLTTHNGIISFTVKSTTNRGDATVSLVSGVAGGFLRMYASSGPAVGIITSEPFLSSVEANGLTLVEIKFNALKDKFGSLVDDGTLMYLELQGAGTLIPADPTDLTGKTAKPSTILGQTSILIKPPTVASIARVVAKAGVVDLTTSCGFTACGYFDIQYTPGSAANSIPVSPARTGIYADPAAAQSLGEIGSTVVTIGPVKDSNGNLVAAGSVLTLNIINGVNVLGNPVTTDSAGMASFQLSGNGTRGEIKVNVSIGDASGSAVVWGYYDIELRPTNTGVAGESYKMFSTYASMSSEPPVTEESWGLIEKWNNMDIQDNQYFGDFKRSGPPKRIASNIPYFTNQCMFSQGPITYFNLCYLDGEYNSSKQLTSQLVIPKNDAAANPLQVGLTSNYLSVHQSSKTGCFVPNDQGGTGKKLTSNPLTTSQGSSIVTLHSSEDNQLVMGDRILVLGLTACNGYGAANFAMELSPSSVSSDSFTLDLGQVATGTGSCGGNNAEVVRIHSLQNNPLALSNGSNIVYVTAQNHRVPNNTYVTLKNIDVAACGANIRANDFSSFFKATYIDANHFSIQIDKLSTVSAACGGTNIDLTPIQDKSILRYVDIMEEQSSCGLPTAESEDARRGKWQTITFDLSFPIRTYMPDLNKTLFFGGFGEYKVLFGFENLTQNLMTNLTTWFLDNGSGAGANAPYNQTQEYNDSHSNIWGDYPEKLALQSSAASSKNSYLFGGLRVNVLPGSGGETSYAASTASDSLYLYQGETQKWKQISPAEDSSLPTADLQKTPFARFQNGVVYIPDNNRLFIGGGFGPVTRQINDNYITSNIDISDLWSFSLTDTENFAWTRECYPCAYPSVAKHTSLTEISSLEAFVDKSLNMTWNPYSQEVLMLWRNNPLSIQKFNPLRTGPKTVATNTHPDWATTVEGSNLQQIEFNKSSGRTYFYKQKTKGISDSELWFWDMDISQKQYIKVEVNLGSPLAKQYIRDFKISVKGYGGIVRESYITSGATTISNVISAGLTVKVYNYTTSSWELVGTNAYSDSNAAEAAGATSIVRSFNANVGTNYVSPNGTMNIIVYPTGVSDGSVGYNILRIDEIVVNGKF